LEIGSDVLEMRTKIEEMDRSVSPRTKQAEWVEVPVNAKEEIIQSTVSRSKLIDHRGCCN
jgi:hypothetical protein